MLRQYNKFIIFILKRNVQEKKYNTKIIKDKGSPDGRAIEFRGKSYQSVSAAAKAITKQSVKDGGSGNSDRFGIESGNTRHQLSAGLQGHKLFTFLLLITLIGGSC